MNCDEEHKLMMTTSVTPENAKCSACARTSSESGETLYYTCTDCDLMFHKKCAELPKQIDHPMHPQHPLILLAKPPYESKTCECQVCQESCKTFGYHCSSCEFGIDILCVMLEDEAVTIPSHHHPVRLIRRPAKFKCNACGLKRWDMSESYKCTKPLCGFWIHKECGLSPEMFTRPDHDHPLLLATSMPVRYRKYDFTCEHCHEDFRPHFWVYYCQRCKYFIHINCIALKARAPTASFYSYTYPLASKRQPPRLAISQLKTISNHLNSDMWLLEEGPQLAEVKVDSHDHSLVLNSNSLEDEDEMICDGCIEPIDRATCPYYECGQHCNFFLHTTCATLPRRLRVGDHIKLERRGFLKRRRNRVLVYGDLHFPKNPWEVVKCFACHSLCNGYTYMVHWLGTDYHLDIKCCYLKDFITHIGHRHDLKTNNQWYNELVQKSPHLHEPLAVDFRWRPTPSYTCSGCGETHKAPHFYCEPCDFSLGYECATLPATVKHRWDKHPLVLSFPPHIRDTDEGEEFYCEVCEEEIYPKHWMYRCVECDRSFHPRCIPTLGESRNIKFGKTVSVKSHLHPLTLVPQAKLTSRCNTCRKWLHWSRAFECAQCGFYLCPDCL